MAKITQRPFPKDLDRLPATAKLALSARCVRRVLPLVEIGWPEVSKEDLETLGTLADLLDRSSSEPVSLRGYANKVSRILKKCPASCARNALLAIADAAHGKPKLVDSVLSSTSSIAPRIMQADLKFAAQDEVCLAIWSDYERLLALSEAEGWTDETPVPANVFGPLWKSAEPAWFQSATPEYKQFIEESADPPVPECDIPVTSAKLSRTIVEALTLQRGVGAEERSHSFRVPATQTAIDEAFSHCGECQTVDELRHFYAFHNGADLFTPNNEQDWPLGVHILPVEWMASELNQMLHWGCIRYWFDQRVVDEENAYTLSIKSDSEEIDEDDQQRLAQFTKNDILVFAAQRMGADRWFCVTRGPLAGKILYFEHETGELELLFADSLEAFFVRLQEYIQSDDWPW